MSQIPIHGDPAESTAPAVPPYEWGLVAVLVVLGAVLRCWQPGHMAVEHFDEGVYASNLYCVDNAYPFRYLYAPSLLPALLEWALILSGGAAGAVMAVNVIAGCTMIPSLWWVGRRWFGPLAGVTAAALGTFSQTHILYSRTALTDVLLCLWMLWGVYWAWKAVLIGHPAATVFAACFASLAWWTKYSGWLTLAISGAGTLAWLISSALHRRAEDVTPPVGPTNPASFQTVTAHEPSTHRGNDVLRSPAAILRWSAIAILAFVGWVRYLIDLQNYGGYAAVAANHAGYFVGLSGWRDGFLRQWDNLAYIETAGGSVALCLAGVILIGIATFDVTVRRLAVAEILVLAAMLAAIGLAAPVTVVALLAIAGFTLTLNRAVRGQIDQSSNLAIWILMAWFMGLLVAVPLYTPYPRLTLPFLVASWLGAGLTVEALAHTPWRGRRLTSDPQRPRNWHSWAAGVAFVAAGVCVIWKDDVSLEDRTGLRTIATEVHQRIPAGERAAVVVCGEPGLFFHLAAQSRDPVREVLPAGDLSSLIPLDTANRRVAWYAVLGPHVLKAGNPPTGDRWAESHLSLVEEWTYAPSKLVLLNEYSPATIETADLEPAVIRLCRITE